MPLPIIANVFRVSLEWLESSTGQIAANVIHVEKASATASAVAAAIDANVQANMWTGICNTASVTQLNVIALDGVSGNYQLAVSGTKWTGQQTTSDFNPALSSIVKFQTGLRGPQHRGRFYTPFVSDVVCTAGHLTFSPATTWQPAWTTFLNALSTAGFPLAVASYKHATATLVSSLVCESVLATQRRRQSRLR